MIDPFNLVNYNRTDEELEEFALMAISVAGKTAVRQCKYLDAWLHTLPGKSPYDKIRACIRNGTLLDEVKRSRLGQHNRLANAFTQVVNLNLRTCTVDDLEKVKGIGMKTSRFFIIYSRRNAQYAVLDTHILKELKSMGYIVEKENSNTTSKKRRKPNLGRRQYLRLESIFVNLAKQQNKSAVKYDAELWAKHARIK